MSQSFQTPFPTDSSRSQAFALKTTRPNETAVGGAHSPVPRSSKPTVKHVYARKKSLHGNSSSRNLKENSFHSKPGSGTAEPKLNLRSKLRARRTTSFASLQDRMKETEAHSGTRLARKSSRASARRSLDSPFCSQPPSPTHREDPDANAQIRRSNSKRGRSSGSESGDTALPETKRRNSSNRLENDFSTAVPLNMPFAPGRSSVPADDAAHLELDRRPSHPDLGFDALFRLGDDLEFLQAGFPAVDFNRPPSQLSIYGPTELTSQAVLTRANSLSSNDRFAADICAASTPYNVNRLTLSAQNPTESQDPRLLEPSPMLFRRDTLDDLTENMSLTSVMEPSVLSNGVAADHTPWITDSLISPPTIYRRQSLVSEQDDCQFTQNGLAGTTDILGFDTTLTSGPGSDNALTADDAAIAREKELVGQVPSLQHEKGAQADADDDHRPRKATRRARSGTVIAPTPVAASAFVGRIRTGTITATNIPLAQRQIRQRSGTITPNSVPNALLEPALHATGRSRSGTIRPKSFIRAPLIEVPTDEALIVNEAAEPHVDGDYDPTPADEMEFSSAPNPDIDLELDDIADVTLCSSHAPNVRSPHAAPPPNKASRKLKLPLLSLATNADAACANGAIDDAETSCAKDGEERKTEGSSETSKRSKRINLKAALGLNPKSGRRRPKQATSGGGNSSRASAPGNKTIDGALAGPSCDGESEEGVLSSDPLDLLSHFDENDFNRPYGGPVKKSGRGRKSKGRGAKASQ